VSWALCHGRTPFLQMALSGVSLVNLRNADRSGVRAEGPALMPCP
jgi:hypothetical protein